MSSAPTSGARLRINSDNVVHEEVDGEVIVIDLSSGSYYSLTGAGSEVWAMLEDGASAAVISARLEARYEAEPGAISEAVAAFLGKLEEFRLVALAAGDDAGANGTASGGATTAPDGDRAAFAPPVLERYTDMQDYFLLDPIHEVSPEGWPKPAQ